MISDKSSMAFCIITLSLFFVGGITGFLNNPLYMGITFVAYLMVIVNIVLIKKSDTDDDFFESEIEK